MPNGGFGLAQKGTPKGVKMEPKVIKMEPKSLLGAVQGRLILLFGAVLGRVENLLIFDVALGRTKIN